jgi:hypothetical protein
MLQDYQLPGQPTIYIPSTGIMSPCEQVLKLVQEIVNLRLSKSKSLVDPRPTSGLTLCLWHFTPFLVTINADTSKIYPTTSLLSLP